MPLYEFQCEKCGLKFEELKNQNEKSDVIPCISCGADSDRLMSSFAPVVAGGSPNETADMSIGRVANQKWQNYHDRQTKRRGNKALKSFDLPKAKDGKFMPVMALGDKKTVEGRKEYVGALQSHREERSKKGVKQFKESGAF
jgi:putative FmdB family regulatory protein